MNLGNQRSQPMVKREQNDLFAAAILFLIGLSVAFKIEIGGSLPVAEAILIPVAVFLFIKPGFYRDPLNRQILWGAFIWLVIQALTDGYRSIPGSDALKGAAKIVTFATSLLGLRGLLGESNKRLGATMMGLGTSYFITALFFPTSYTIDDPWKFAYGLGATLLALGLLVFLGLRVILLWGFCLIGLGCFHFMMNFRSMAGACMLPGCLLLVYPLWNKARISVRVGLSVGGALAVLIAYGILADRGFLGEMAQSKYQFQRASDGSILTLLAAGRREHRASLKAIQDSPIIGYGSWAKHPEYYQFVLSDEDIALNRNANNLAELGTIPSHSHIMGAWVDGGIIPAALWIAFTIYIYNRFMRIRIAPDARILVGFYYGVITFWTILFSPLGVGQRFVTALGIVAILIASSRSNLLMPKPPLKQL